MVALEPLATLAGRVVDADGNPVSGAAIRTDPLPGGDFSLSLGQVATDKEGTVRRARRADRLQLHPRGRERGRGQQPTRRLLKGPGRAAGQIHRRGRDPIHARLRKRTRSHQESEPMRSSPWSPYRPGPSAPWDLARAWTLRRRAGFAATWNELQRDLTDGPDAAVTRVLAGTCRTEGVSAEFATTADLLGDAAASAGDAHRLQAWWLYRMLFTPDPLAERLTLLWHNHFATSQLKVDDVVGDEAAERRVPPPCPRAVRRPAAGDVERPGPARLARRPVEPQGQAQREPRPRDDGAVHARGRQLLRARCQGGRAGADRGGRSIRGDTHSARTGTTTGPRPSWGRPAASTAISSRKPSSRIPPPRDGWRGGSAGRSSARASPRNRPSQPSPNRCVATTCISAARSR